MNIKAQVWIETVLYTLIAIALIGLVLGFVTPKITDAKDKAAVEQTIDALNVVDEKINAVLDATDNIRSLDFTMKRGELLINATDDSISFIFDDLRKPYSEPNSSINIGRVNVSSFKTQKKISVILSLNYKNTINLTSEGLDSTKIYTEAQIPYKFSIWNRGLVNYPLSNLNVVDIKELGG